MAYQKQTWEDLPSRNTPITASKLNHMEDGIYEAYEHGGGGETLPVGSEIDYDGQTVPTGWEEIDNPEIYSTDEIKTNKVYVDENGVEHDVYRKIIRGTKENDDLNLGVVSNDLTKVTKTHGMFIDLSNNEKALPYYYSNAIWLSYEINNLGKLLLYGATSQYSKGEVEITVEYTKD